MIRGIERESNTNIRLAALSLLCATSADIARELRGDATPSQTKQPKLPKPKPLPIPQPPQPQPTAPQPQAQPSDAEPERDRRE